jgi:protein ImuB
MCAVTAALYACLCVREFPAQALLRLRGELKEQPCVVLEGDPPLQQVCSLNTKARLLGAACGMTRVEMETFPACIVLQRCAQAEAATRAALLACAGVFSPRVAEQSGSTVLLCILDIAGTETLFGPPQALATGLLQRVRALGMTATLTVSANYHAAVCMAKCLSRGNPIRVIAAGDEAAALAPLPLKVLDLTKAQAETFALWGIHTLGMLAALPENELTARLGQAARRLRQQALGTLPHLFQIVEQPLTLAGYLELDSPVEILESLLFVIGVMLDSLIARARTDIVALASITLTLSLERTGTHTRTVRPALPGNEKHLWLKLLHLDLQAHPPGAPVLSISLAAEPGVTGKIQGGLFSPQLPEPSRLEVTLARIRAIVGEQRVGCAVLLDTHAPEIFSLQPFIMPSGQISACTPAVSRTTLRRLRPPESSAVMMREGRPASFYFRQCRYLVEQAHGPWLQSGCWWSEDGWQMEQWDLVARAHNDSLLCCCVWRNPADGRWVISGLYD